MSTYNVKSDKQFFDKFNEIQLKVLELSCLFQNGDIEVSDIEVREWNNIAYKLQNDLTSLIREVNYRFKY